MPALSEVALPHAPAELTGDRLKRGGRRHRQSRLRLRALGGEARAVAVGSGCPNHPLENLVPLGAHASLWLGQPPAEETIESATLHARRHASLHDGGAEERHGTRRILRRVLRVYRARDRRGEKLARKHLAGEPVWFPNASHFRRRRSWPGAARVAVRPRGHRARGRYPRPRSRTSQKRGISTKSSAQPIPPYPPERWQLGSFSGGCALKNFGVIGKRIVLLDTGGPTNRWRIFRRAFLGRSRSRNRTSNWASRACWPIGPK